MVVRLAERTGPNLLASGATAPAPVGKPRGFPGYDELTCKILAEVAHYDSFVEFGGLCDLFRSGITAARRERASNESDLTT